MRYHATLDVHGRTARRRNPVGRVLENGGSGDVAKSVVGPNQAVTIAFHPNIVDVRNYETGTGLQVDRVASYLSDPRILDIEITASGRLDVYPLGELIDPTVLHCELCPRLPLNGTQPGG